MTKDLCFKKVGDYSSETISEIFEIITERAPNIETLYLEHFNIKSKLVKNFKTLLSKCTNLKSLRVSLDSSHDSAIYDLMIKENFQNPDLAIQNRLKTIYYINFNQFLKPEHIVKLLILLPNVQVLKGIKLGEAISLYSTSACLKPELRTLNLTTFSDIRTTQSRFNKCAEFCPKVKSVCLHKPEKDVIQMLSKFP